MFAELIGNSRKVIFEDTGHVAMLERPQAFNALMRARAQTLRAKDLKTAVLTDPDGRLLGVVRREDLPSTEGT